MSRRQRQSGQSVSLFPFLSILACVIGVLTLMITALALSQMNTKSDDEAIARAEEAERLREQLQDGREEIETSGADVKRALEILDEIEKLRKELARAQVELDKLLAAEKERKKAAKTAQDLAAKDKVLKAKLQAEADRYSKRIAAIKKEIVELAEKAKPLKQELAKRKRPPDAARVIVQPGGTGSDVRPTFIECSAEGMVLYDSEPPFRIGKQEKFEENKRFLSLLDRVRKQPKGTVVFLVRTDGLSVYNRARTIAWGRETVNGKLPLIGQGKVDLSVFKKFLKN